MSNPPHDVVTGAFGYTGRHIARRLLSADRRVSTLTSRPEMAAVLEDRVAALPWRWDDPAALARQLEGVDTLYNTYWVRFDHGEQTHARAVANSRTLMDAARAAGIRRVVHVSIAHADSRSPLPYYRGKGQVEEAVAASGLSYAIVRPTLVYGDVDILVNNIAWFLRRLPVAGVPGDGSYLVRPVHVEDVAALAVRLSSGPADATVNAVGPETYTFRDLVRLIGRRIGRDIPVLGLPDRLMLIATGLAGRLLGDVVLTADEVRGLSAGLLHTTGRATGSASFAGWLRDNSDWLGQTYRSELRAHYR